MVQTLAQNGVIFPLKLRGRLFTQDDISIVRACVSDYYDKGRTQISRKVSARLNWKQTNGALKTRACHDVLLTLDKMRLIELPPPKTNGGLPKTKKPQPSRLSQFDLSTPITEFPSELSLEIVQTTKASQIWNQLVDSFHYLGHKISVGRCIKYLIWSNERLIGALAFSSPAWQITSRDSLLSEIGIRKEEIRDVVINNSRFLILPNVKVPNLASTILSIATKRVIVDWKAYYAITPLVAETFVHPLRYKGTCYKAANWIEIGVTKGYAKRGASYLTNEEPKKILIYGLNKQIRRTLEIAFKVVTE